MNNLFQYVPGNSLIHRLNPVTKIFLTIIICVAAFVTDRLVFLAGLLALDLLIGLVAGVADRTLNIFKGLLKIAAFLFLLQVLLTRKGTPVFWIITDQGLLTAGKVVLRLVVVCMPLALVLAVTRITDLTNARDHGSADRAGRGFRQGKRAEKVLHDPAAVRSAADLFRPPDGPDGRCRGGARFPAADPRIRL